MTDTSREAVEALAKTADQCELQFSDPVAATLRALLNERDALREALTPSADTKADYMSEVECDCPTENWRHYVPWTSIKSIMAMIRARAALKETTDE